MFAQDIVIPLGIGLAIFLFGLKAMEIGLNEWAGPFLFAFMRRFTNTPFRGLVTGTVATTALQSSAVVTVITIGLVNAGVLTFRQTLGIVLGANIGACITTEMLGLDVSERALPLLLGSSTVWLVLLLLPLRNAQHKRQLQPHARALRFLARYSIPLRCFVLTLCGFAAILLGMEWMYSIVPDLQSRGLFVWFLEQSQRSLLWGLLAGALITAVIQSSTATITVAMGLAAVQAISVELGIAIVLGANIGTCSTALIACIGGSRAGQYVAWSNILLNIGGSLLFFPFIQQLEWLSSIGTSSPYDQLARAQAIFNVICSAFALPFCYIGFNTPRMSPLGR